MFAGTANTKACPPTAAGNTYLCRVREALAYLTDLAPSFSCTFLTAHSVSITFR